MGNFPRYPVILVWLQRIANARGVSLKDASCKARYIFGYPEDVQKAPPSVSQGVGRRCPDRSSLYFKSRSSGKFAG